jgi:small subunit ribosomal protein SAe
MSADKNIQEQNDIKMLLSCKSHIGNTNCNIQMIPYIFGKNDKGCHILNPKFTLEKIRLAARAICAIENPADVVVVSGHDFCQRAALKFARYTRATALATHFTPGTFTNQIQKKYIEPRLLIVADPQHDHQAVAESSYVNVPVIAVCDADSPLRFVDIAIPSNNRGRTQIGIIFWMLAREVLRVRGDLPYNKNWDVMPDLFFYREPEEKKKKEEEEEDYAEEEFTSYGIRDRQMCPAQEEIDAAQRQERRSGF